MDSTGVHCSTTSSYDVSLAEDPILIDDIQVVPCASGIRAFQEFYDDEKRIQQLSSRRMAILRYLKSIARLILNLGHK
jgi:hypothetical protein